MIPQEDGRELQAIDFVVSANPGEDVQAQFDLMVDLIYQWHDQFGTACKELTVGFIGSPKIHEALMERLLLFVRQEEPLRPLFDQLGRVDVALISPEGKVLKESAMKFDQGQAEAVTPDSRSFSSPLKK